MTSTCRSALRFTLASLDALSPDTPSACTETPPREILTMNTVSSSPEAHCPCRPFSPLTIFARSTARRPLSVGANTLSIGPPRPSPPARNPVGHPDRHLSGGVAIRLGRPLLTRSQPSPLTGLDACLARPRRSRPTLTGHRLLRLATITGTVPAVGCSLARTPCATPIPAASVTGASASLSTARPAPRAP